MIQREEGRGRYEERVGEIKGGEEIKRVREGDGMRERDGGEIVIVLKLNIVQESDNEKGRVRNRLWGRGMNQDNEGESTIRGREG